MSNEVEERSALTSTAPRPAPTSERDREVDRDSKEPIVEKKLPRIAEEDQELVPLFAPDVAKDFRSRWVAVQSSFVDDPRDAVKRGDDLVAEVMKSLTETFSKERANLEGQLDQTDKASTETLRVALRRYRSFFERLLSL
jgi:hypothetical protein